MLFHTALGSVSSAGALRQSNRTPSKRQRTAMPERLNLRIADAGMDVVVPAKRGSECRPSLVAGDRTFAKLGCSEQERSGEAAGGSRRLPRPTARRYSTRSGR